MQKIEKIIKKAIVNIAKKSAGMEANSACMLLNFQPKEPQDVKKFA